MADGPFKPSVQFEFPTIDVEAARGLAVEGDHEDRPQSAHKQSSLRQRNPKHLEIDASSSQNATGGQRVYLGSYVQATPRGSADTQSLDSHPAPSRRSSRSHLQLEHLLSPDDLCVNDYGVQELRDGFFDASFNRPPAKRAADDTGDASATLPNAFQKHHPLSVSRFVPQQIKGARSFLRKITTSRAGLQLFKSFLGVFICYIICLVPASRDWLGKYNYIIVVSAIVNHPGRKVGSQIDGAVLTSFGTIAGLAWGSLALYVSTSDTTARNGYGGVLAAFLIVFTATFGWLRCVYIRFYQAVLCAGFAIFYMCLADTGTVVSWLKVFDYGIPFVLGQAICLAVSISILPDAGSRSLAMTIHESLEIIQEGFELPYQPTPSLRRNLAWHFVKLSAAVRDFAIEFAVSRYHSDEITRTRNLIQAVIRSLLSIKTETTLFDVRVDNIDTQGDPSLGDIDRHAAGLIRQYLAGPTRSLIDAMKISIKEADNILLYLGGQKAMPELPKPSASAAERLRAAMGRFDTADLALLSRPDLPASYAKQSDCTELLLFLHPVRQSADKVETFAQQVLEMQKRRRGWRIRMPTYPWKKAFTRVNAQVRHDRGGLTAAYYFRSQRETQQILTGLQSTVYKPNRAHEAADQAPQNPSTVDDIHLEGSDVDSGKHNTQARVAILRHQVWACLHRLQGFESRFALKVTLVTTLISIPAWLPQSRRWWNTNESWWAVVMVWIMMHPRVGGTFQDLVVRISCAALGALWGGLAYAAGNGNPYVIAAFAVVYMVPMLYRFTQSSHPRSGVVGCLSFAVVSLSIYTNISQQSVLNVAWTRGLSFLSGIAAAIVVNWILWPFIARHELRKSVSAMLLHCAILYRAVVSKYIYYEEGQQPGPADIARSEMLEGRLREGFVRIQQLLELTRHEMRLRAPFDALPYGGLISACETFFEHLVQVRESSLYFQPAMGATSSAPDNTSLISYRRDAVAAILLNLYTYACALRGNQPVPRYIPSAAAARQKLLDQMDIVEAEAAAKERAQSQADPQSLDSIRSGSSTKNAREKGQRRWADVYQYAFSGALTDIVAEVLEMQRCTTQICGEAEWE